MNRLNELLGEIRRLRDCLEYISDPTSSIVRGAERSGYSINGVMTLELANNADHLKAKAFDTLEKTPQNIKECLKAATQQVGMPNE